MNCVSCGYDGFDQDMLDMGSLCPKCYADQDTGERLGSIESRAKSPKVAQTNSATSEQSPVDSPLFVD